MPDLPYPCTECGRRFLTDHALRAHARAVHGPGAKHRAAVAAVEQKRRTAAPRGPVSRSMRSFAERHSLTCTWCGEPVRLDVEVRHSLAPTREHLVPASAGGSHRSENLALAHRRCNARRGTIAADAYRRLLAGEAVTYAEMCPFNLNAEVTR